MSEHQLHHPHQRLQHTTREKQSSMTRRSRTPSVHGCHTLEDQATEDMSVERHLEESVMFHHAHNQSV